MGTSNLEIAITALNEATSEIEGLKASLEGLKSTTGEASGAMKEADNTGKDWTGSLNDLAEGLTGFNIATLAGVGGVIALADAVKGAVTDTMDYENEVRKISTVSGTTSEETSKLISLFERFDITGSSLTFMMRGLARQGIEPNIENIKQLSVEFNALPTQAERNTFAMQMFGRAGLDVEQMLKQGPDAIQGYVDSTNSMIVVNQTQMDQEFKLKQDTFDLQEQWKGFTITVGTAVIPVLDGLVTTTNENIHAQEIMNSTVTAGVDPRKMLTAVEKAEADIRAEATTMTDDWAKEEMIATAATKDSTGASATNAAALETLKQKTAAAKEATKDNNEELKLVTTSFGKLTEQMLYNEASQGLDAKAALDLAEKMGLVKESTYIALTAAQKYNAEYLAGTLTLQQYEKDILAIRTAEDMLTNKTITIRINEQLNAEYGGGGLGAAMRDRQGGGGGGNIIQTGSGGLGGGRAIGGWGSGDTVVGEAGPERVRLPLGSYVQNNYDMRTTYNLQAHYPSYQDPHAARNDLIGMTMLRNAGATKWAS